MTEDGIPKLDRLFKFKNFKDAISFTDAVGAAAEEEGHHPRITTEWGKVAVTWWTHKIKNLHKNDFIMAAKTDAIYKKYCCRCKLRIVSGNRLRSIRELRILTTHAEEISKGECH